MIELNENSWAARLYNWSYRIWCPFIYRSSYSSRHPNLCTLIRTMFVWGPLVIAFHLLSALTLGYVFLWFPLSYFASGYLQFWFIVAIGVSIICGFVWLITKVAPGAADYIEQKYQSKHSIEIRTFFSLIFQWIKDTHDQVCSPINIMQTPKEGKVK